MSAGLNQIAEHLAVLTDSLDDDHGVAVVTIAGTHVTPLDLAHRSNIAGTVDRIAGTVDRAHVYTGAAAMSRSRYEEIRAENKRTRSNKRGGKADTSGMLGVFADIDVAGPHHAAENLPETIDDAVGIVEEMMLEPTLLVDSGGGLQALWLLHEAVIFDTGNAEMDRAVADGILSSWCATVADHANRIGGWHVDQIGELARLLRLAGTTNIKSAPPVPVRIIGRGPRYRLPELLDHIVEEPGETGDAQDAAGVLPTGNAGESCGTRRTSSSGGPNVLDAWRVARWSDVWPSDWEAIGTSTRSDGQAELWRRPGAKSPYSVVCWENGCQVHSSSIEGLPPGGYSKAEVAAWARGMTVRELASAMWAEVAS